MIRRSNVFVHLYAHTCEERGEWKARYIAKTIKRCDTARLATFPSFLSFFSLRFVTRLVFINFHASPRRRGARPRFEWCHYPGSNSLIINSLSQNTIESRTTGSSFTPFRAGTCFSAASTLSPPLLAAVLRCCCRSSTRPHSLISGRKKEKIEEEEEENVEEQKEEQGSGDAWNKNSSLNTLGWNILPSAYLRNRACSARLALVWTEIKVTGASSPGFNVGRIEDRKWFLSWTISWERTIFLEGSCCSW